MKGSLIALHFIITLVSAYEHSPVNFKDKLLVIDTICN